MGVGVSEVATVFTEEFRRGARRTWYRVSTLAIPVVLLVLAIAVPIVRGVLLDGKDGAGAGARRAGLVDLSGVLAPDNIPSDADLRVIADRETGIRALVAGEVSTLFVISEDYLTTGRIEWLHTRGGIAAAVSGETATERIQEVLRERLIGDALPADVKTRFLAPASFQSYVVREDGSVEEGAAAAKFLSVSYIFAMLLMFGIFTGSGFLLESVSDEKESRMIEVLLTSVSPLGVMTGKVLAMGAMGLLQVSVWAASVALIGPRIMKGVPELGQLAVDPVLLFWVAAFFLAGYFVLAVVMAGIGAATASYREGSQISILVLLPAASPFWVFQLIVGNPDGGLARGLSFFPITAPLTMMLRMGASDVALVEIVASLAVTVLSGFGLLWASARVFRAGLLMYGQRMSLARVFRALRQAA